MNNKTILFSILLAAAVGSVFSLSTSSFISDFTEAYAGKTLNSDDVAKTLQVRIMVEGYREQLIYDSFSRVGFVRSSGVEFLLESLPSKDKELYYKIIKNNLGPTPKRIQISLDLFSGDGTLIETLTYSKCLVTSYFVHVNDSKGKYSFLDNSTADLEIREITKFECAGFKLIT